MVLSGGGRLMAAPGKQLDEVRRKILVQQKKSHFR